eukprot:TRINITY_DN17742_c0_g1_i1.p1 TRINITY_DN17742_c0_g1~~TRINITY_DN17742_c0_g1_i1.p1  ORF type:complete len:352 (-),score=83.72 TRINITY_DN17742_c0_g1_i1:16-1071(-)
MSFSDIVDPFSLDSDVLDLGDMKWDGLDNLLVAKPTVHHHNDSRISVFERFDLDKIEDSQLFNVGNDRFSFYVQKMSPPKAAPKKTAIPNQTRALGSNKENNSNIPVKESSKPVKPKTSLPTVELVPNDVAPLPQSASVLSDPSTKPAITKPKMTSISIPTKPDPVQPRLTSPRQSKIASPRHSIAAMPSPKKSILASKAVAKPSAPSSIPSSTSSTVTTAKRSLLPTKSVSSLPTSSALPKKTIVAPSKPSSSIPVAVIAPTSTINVAASIPLPPSPVQETKVLKTPKTPSGPSQQELLEKNRILEDRIQKLEDEMVKMEHQHRADRLEFLKRLEALEKLYSTEVDDEDL